MLNLEDFKIKYIESGTVTKVTIPAKKKRPPRRNNRHPREGALRLPTLKASKPKPRQMIDLVRLHAYKAGEFFLVDVPKKEARKKRIELNKDGFVIAHTELV